LKEILTDDLLDKQSERATAARVVSEGAEPHQRARVVKLAT
jgi:hypothetical protein